MRFLRFSMWLEKKFFFVELMVAVATIYKYKRRGRSKHMYMYTVGSLFKSDHTNPPFLNHTIILFWASYHAD